MPSSAAHAQLQAWQREAERALEARDYRQAHGLCMAILAEEPLYPDAYYLLALIAAEHGNFGKALDVIERALRLDRDRPDFQAQRARFLIGLNRSHEATEAALLALQLEPQDAFTLSTIGVALTQAGAQLEALEPLRAAARLAPNNAAYRYNLGTALQFAGDFAAAEVEYRAALQLEPQHCRAWSALSQLRTNVLTPAAVEFLERLLAEHTLDVDGELNLRHALAKHCEDNGEYARAFEHLQRGKAHKRATLDYSIDRDVALFEAVGSVCIEAFCSTADGYASEEPIFIVGMPRTGTTLIERILSSHPDVFAAGELPNFALAVKCAAGTSGPYVLDRETLLAAADLDFAAIGREYLESTRPRTGHTPRFIDKMPLNFFYAAFIHRALPQARLICLRRNALDTCLSNYRQLFATNFPYYDYAYDLLDTGRYYQQFERLVGTWRERLPRHFLEVCYEDVVVNPERESRRLLEFCGLDFRPEVLAFHENASPVSTASSVQVRQPIYRTSVDRWRRYETQLQPLRALLAQTVSGET